MQQPKDKRVLETLVPARNFTITLADRMRAAGGAPAYIRRKRRIEDLEEDIVRSMVELIDEVAHREPELSKGRVEAEVVQRVGTRRVALMNDLIAKHNRYYPMEANLPIDPRSGVLLEGVGGGRWMPLAHMTVEQLLQKARAERGEADD